MSVYQDKRGADESVRVAKEWITQHAGNIGAGAPTIQEGSVILHLK